MTYPLLPLRRSFRIINGGTPTLELENWDGEIPWATPVDLGAAGLTIEHTERTLTEAGLASGSRLAPAGSILISTRAPIGHLAVCAVAMAFNQGCRALAPIDDSDPRFFAYQLMAERSNLELAGQGSTFLELSSEALATFRLSTPPVDEQRRIADFLDDQVARLDRAIALRTDQADLLRVRASAYAETVLRPVGEWTEVPARHLVGEVAVGIVIQPAALYTHSAEGVPAVRGTDIAPGRIQTANLVRISNEGHADNPRSRLRHGDVLVVRSGRAGAAARVPVPLVGGNCIDVVIVRAGPTLDAGYLEHSINSQRAQDAISEHSTGAIQRHFGVDAMRSLPLVRRPLAEQVKISQRLDRSREEYEKAVQLVLSGRDTLVERKQALITAAVTGQLDVTTARAVAS
jgi:type I restriction enzyme, S subunit